MIYGLSVSDWHNGAKSYEEMVTECYSENGIITKIHEYCTDPNFIGVTISGDYYDSKIPLNDTRTILANNMILEIYNVCKENDKYFIIIRGTYSHDFSQLDNFLALELQYSKFKLFSTVTEFTMNDLHCLAIPEEYIEDQDTYYKEYFSKKYDLIFGHGNINFAANLHNSAERNMTKAPTFSEVTLSKICKLCLFGHIHQHVSYKNVFYNSSYSRLCFGEEDPKGYLLYYIDGKKSKVKHIENIYAPIMDTIVIDKILDDYEINSSVDIIENINLIYSIISERKIFDEQRVNLKIKFTKKYAEYYIQVKEAFSNNKNIFIEGLTLSSIFTNDEKIEIEKEESKYDFVNSNDTLQNKIKLFINEKFGNDVGLTITDDLIQEALSKE